jgi:hypothetical protein
MPRNAFRRFLFFPAMQNGEHLQMDDREGVLSFPGESI